MHRVSSIAQRFVVLALLGSSCASASGEEPASLVLTQGNVHTLDASRPHATAICIRAERIVRVGSVEDVRRCVGATSGCQWPADRTHPWSAVSR